MFDFENNILYSKTKMSTTIRTDTHYPGNFSVLSGAKDRLVQITGGNASSIDQARHLMEDTIRRNQTPEPPTHHRVGINNRYEIPLIVLGKKDFERLKFRLIRFRHY